MYHDPMISKLVCWGKNRKEAMDRLNLGLDEYVIKGVIHNAGFGKSIINNKAFMEGNYTTAFIPTYYKDGFKGEVMTTDDQKLLSIVAFKMCHNIDKNNHLKGVKYPEFNKALNPLYCVTDGKTYKITKNLEKKSFTVELVDEKGEKTHVDNAKVYNFKMYWDTLIKTDLISETTGEVANKTVQFMDVQNGTKYKFYYRGSHVEVDVYDETQYKLKKYMPTMKKIDTSRLVLSPMPGGVVSVNVTPALS